MRFSVHEMSLAVRITRRRSEATTILTPGGDVLKEYGITSSMSRRDNCWDNACSETLFGSWKVVRLHGQRLGTRRLAKDETIAWLLWYNKVRLHSTLAYVSPMQFESEWLAKQANA